jgi:hypothetical protein
MSTKPKADADPDISTGNGLLVYYAEGPDKEVLRSSVSNFRTVANRWARKRGPGYKVVQRVLPLTDLSALPAMVVKPYKGMATSAPAKKAVAKKSAAKKVAAKKASKAKTSKKPAKATAPERRKRVNVPAESQEESRVA